jgi:geranylgeranyl reductase family protein
MDCDVIVVGAGPSGSAAAYDLAAAGRSVLLLDKRRFPRTKACGGGLTVRTLRRLRYSVAPVVRQVCTELVLAKRSSGSVKLTGRSALCSMTVRSEFDHFCLERTVERGAEFRLVSHIDDVEESERGVTVRTNAGPIRCGYLIGADGANSVVRRFMPGASRIVKGFAIEAIARPSLLPPMTFEFDAVRYGYGWLFPKGDHVNVGLYTNSVTSRPRRAELLRYAREKLGDVELEQVVGHHVGLGGWRGAAASARIALVGDAAGVVEPLLGEGIHGAIATGQAAAAAALGALRGDADFRASYARRLRPLLSDLSTCHRDAVRFYRHVEAGYRALTSRLIASVLIRGYARGMSLSQMRRWCALLALPALPQTRF